MDSEYERYMERQSAARLLKRFRTAYLAMINDIVELKKHEKIVTPEQEKFWSEFAKELKRNEMFLEELEVRWGILTE